MDLLQRAGGQVGGKEPARPSFGSGSANGFDQNAVAINCDGAGQIERGQRREGVTAKLGIGILRLVLIVTRTMRQACRWRKVPMPLHHAAQRRWDVETSQMIL